MNCYKQTNNNVIMTEKKNKQSIELKCKRCGHTWQYKGSGIVTVCSKCRTSVKVRKFNPELDMIKTGD